MAIIRYANQDPFQGFQTLQDTVNRFFNEPSGNRPWVPAVDIRETDHELVVKADIPGMKFEDIDVRLENGTLTLRGERKFEEEKKEGGWHRVERSYGTFERVFTLPDSVNPEGVTADYKNGTLTVTLPKKEIAKPRQIKVQVNQ
jgi:HSP20 family protein